jgi:hypothetical protein
LNPSKSAPHGFQFYPPEFTLSSFGQSAESSPAGLGASHDGLSDPFPQLMLLSN